MRSNSSAFAKSPLKWIDNFPPFLLFKNPRTNPLVARKTGCPLSLRVSIIIFADRFHSFSGLYVCVPYHFLFSSWTEKRPLSLRESVCVLPDFRRSRPIDITVHRHEDDPIFEIFWFDSACVPCLFLKSRSSSNVVCLVKIFHPNSTGSPSIPYNS